MSSQFSINNRGEIVPNPGHEAAWSFFEERVATKYVSVRNLLSSIEPRTVCRHESNCKILTVMIANSSQDDLWWLLSSYPQTVRDYLRYSRAEWRVENLFSPEMITALKVIA